MKTLILLGMIGCSGQLCGAETGPGTDVSVSRLNNCGRNFYAIGRNAEDYLAHELIALAPGSLLDNPEQILEKKELVAALQAFADSGMLSFAEKRALLGRMDNLTLERIGAERMGGATAAAAGGALARAVARAKHFFEYAEEGSRLRAGVAPNVRSWIETHLAAKNWKFDDLIREANLSPHERNLVADLLSPPTPNVRPLNRETENFLIGRLSSHFKKSAAPPPPPKEQPPAPPAFVDWIQTENKLRGWDVQTLRFLALQKSDAELVTKILAGQTTLAEQKPFIRNRILHGALGAYRKFPPGTESSAPLAGETVADWLQRELTDRQYAIPVESDNAQFWQDIGLGSQAHRHSVLGAIKGDATEMAPYVRTRLFRFFRERPVTRP